MRLPGFRKRFAKSFICPSSSHGNLSDTATSMIRSSEAERCGEGGGGAPVSGTTLLDATHRETVSRDRSHREQPAGGPGRRELDRWIDWALSHPAWAVQKWKTKKPFSTFTPPRLRLRLDVRIDESWSMFGPNRWLVERSSTGR